MCNVKRVIREDHGFDVLKHDQRALCLPVSAEAVAQAAKIDRLAGERRKLPGEFRAGYAAVVVQQSPHLDAKALDLLRRRFRRAVWLRFPGFPGNFDEIKKFLHRLAHKKRDGVGDPDISALAENGAVYG